MADLQPTVKDAFFSPKNEAMLQRLLNTDVQRRIGGDLGEKQEVRLKKTIHHYMGEVYYNPENAGQPIQSLNKEVLRAVVPDFMGYLKRNETAPRPTTAAGMETVRMDVTSRFDQMQTERQGETKALPAPPKFQVSLDDADAPSSLSLFEQAKRAREEEARRMEEAVAPAAPPAAVLPVAITPAARAAANDLMARLGSEDDFRAGNLQAAAGTVAALAARDAARTAALDANRNTIMPVPPDGRGVLFGENGGLLGPRSAGIAIANPTLALPDAVRTRPPLPQDIIKPQDDILKYKENEYNLFIYSADRDWVNNTTENRYNFSVNFDPANNRSGFGLSPATNIRFKNISRIELVKVIMPTEACEVLVTRDPLTGAYETDYSINALSYPYLQVRIDELNNNGYGTNDGLNNSFGVISYDAYWASDSGLKNRGWTRMIPKFLKCQKIYTPTPLATLNKLTIQIQKPDGNLFCTSADALDVSGAVFSSMLGSSEYWSGNTTTDTTGTKYVDTSGEFIWIQTSKWFSEFAITQGDRIVLKNLNFPSTFAAYNTQAANDMLNYLQRPEGHVVVDIARNFITTVLNFKTGSNDAGYSNFIIIRNDMVDPSTGLISLKSWATTTALLNAIKKTSGSGPGFSSGGRLLNLNHQIQVIFRVITRDMDSATRIRPDNL